MQLMNVDSRSGDCVFEAEQVIDRPRDEVFAFFSDPANLEQITPSWLSFKIVERNGAEMRRGSEFTYALRVRGLPMKWRSLIAEWTPRERFIDVQLSGPYARWHHLHEFADGPNGSTIVRDRVVYRLPFGRLGRFFAGWYVRNDVEKIFAHRRARTEALLAA